MSARTAVELADRRRDLAERDVRAGTSLGRAAVYLHVVQQTPTLPRWWSWVRSLLLDGVTPGRVREALAAAFDLVDIEAGAPEVLAAICGRPDPRRAHQMARYWLACIRAGNDPELAARKLLRVFDLVPRRLDPTSPEP